MDDYDEKEARREIRGYIKGLKADGVAIRARWKCGLPIITIRDNVTEFDTITSALAWVSGVWIGYHAKCDDVERGSIRK